MWITHNEHIYMQMMGSACGQPSHPLRGRKEIVIFLSKTVCSLHCVLSASECEHNALSITLVGGWMRPWSTSTVIYRDRNPRFSGVTAPSIVHCAAVYSSPTYLFFNTTLGKLKAFKVLYSMLSFSIVLSICLCPLKLSRYNFLQPWEPSQIYLIMYVSAPVHEGTQGQRADTGWA